MLPYSVSVQGSALGTLICTRHYILQTLFDPVALSASMPCAREGRFSGGKGRGRESLPALRRLYSKRYVDALGINIAYAFQTAGL